MIPPICFLCDKDFRHNMEEGDLIYFALTKENVEWHNNQKKEGFIGHPPEAAWFCGEHLSKAKELEHLTLPEALKVLKEFFPGL